MKHTFLWLTVAAAAFHLSAKELDVDKSHSEIQFTVSHMVVSKTKGQFKEFEAKVDVTDGKLVSVNATIPVSSLDTDNEKRDSHLKSPDFFNEAEYPNITFVSTKVEAGKLHGKLTILDVTKDVVLDLEFLGPVTSPWGKTVYGLNLDGEIDRTEFGLTWNKALEAGGVVVGDMVHLSISVELTE
ncbi:YceI family protein [Kiritimatiellota bacterium B12222]|nr:YceI family protein [Kiritimatiellota bacterium B12222]